MTLTASAKNYENLTQVLVFFLFPRISGNSFSGKFKQFDPKKKHIENPDMPFIVYCMLFNE